MARTDEPAGRVTKKSKGKKVAKPKPSTQPSSSAKQKKRGRQSAPTTKDLYDKFMTMKFEQAKFVDSEVLGELGIYEDVMLLLRNMGLEKFMSMRETADQELTCDFLSSLRARFFDGNDESDRVEYEKFGRGFIEYTISGQQFQVKFSDLCTIFGFEEEGTSFNNHFVYPFGEHKRIWDTIASGNYEPGTSKSAAIRNPALRYALKALLHVFYAKVEIDTISGEELEFLGLGLKPLFPVLRDGGQFHGPKTKTCLASILARSLMEYKTWAWRTKAKKASIGIGWIATAIVRATTENLEVDPVDLPLMNRTYLLKTLFIRRHNKTSFAYSFYPAANTRARVLLPHPHLTRLDSLENLIFLPPAEFYLEPPQVEYPEPVLGAARYDFAPYDGPMTGATSSAHERINLLQRKTKWQQRIIEKMAKAMKKMKRTIKSMKRSMGDKGCKGNDVDDLEAQREPMEMGEGTSSHHDKGKRKARSPTPTSSNELISLGSDSSGSASPSQSD